MNFKTIDELSKSLGVTNQAAQELLEANSLSLDDIDSVILESLKADLTGSIANRLKNKPVPARSQQSSQSELAVREKAPNTPAVQPMKAIGKEGVQRSQQRKAETTTDVMTATSDAHSDLMERTLEKFKAKVSDKTEDLSEKMAEVLASQTFSQFETVADFFGVKMNSTDEFIQSIQDAIDVEVVQ